MCIILAAWRADPEFPLVVAANRDEFFARPTRSAGFWPEAPYLLAGCDLSAGGSWLGITRNGRFAALTNFRDPAREKDNVVSRGKLVSQFLQGNLEPIDYLDEIRAMASEYNGFNLLVADRQTMACYNNIENRTDSLIPGIHGLSNHALNTPWPKVTAATTALNGSLGRLPDTTQLFSFLRDETIADDESLPRTGVPLETERFLSSIFVRAPTSMAYGTRCSTVLVIARDGRIIFDEQEWIIDATVGRRHRFRFTLQEHGRSAQ